jgi:hypothetical protein
LDEVFTTAGEGIIPQFRAPAREPVWILSALYSGPQDLVDLANRVAARYHDESPDWKPGMQRGKAYNIFQSNNFTFLLHRFDHLLTSAARDVMTWHAERACATLHGSGQPDTKFQGGNDNMPMLASLGLILGGEKLGDAQAIAQGVWNLNQFRRLLSRSAWASEYNSSTYSPVTLKAVTQIATYAHDPEIRALARQIEHRLWAEVLLHYHPGTLHQAGPNARGYSVDQAGHNHLLQLLFWLVFGEEVTGRDMLKSYFEPDGTEVIHFEGSYIQNIAEFCDFIDAEFHVPDSLAPLIHARQYPAMLRGRTEVGGQCDGIANVAHTCTYMEEDFSIGSVNGPWVNGEQGTSLYVTYKRRHQLTTWRDAATVFLRYHTADQKMGTMDVSADGRDKGDRFMPNRAWYYAIQKRDTALVLATPNPKAVTEPVEALRLKVVFPAHYGQITRSIIGELGAVDGAHGETDQVVPVSIQAGEVFIHIQPLLPTNLPRNAALRFGREGNYEILELINYEGPPLAFSRLALSRVLNGLVMTVKSRHSFESLEAFHHRFSRCVITDYLSLRRRFMLFQREDVEFEVTYSPDPFGVQTEGIDGRNVPRPMYESNQIDVDTLPFMVGPVARNAPVFRWETLRMPPWPNAWIIGSRGLPNQPSYSARCQDFSEDPA